MIVYFADRNMKVLGQASTHLPKGIRITDDLKTENVDTGVAVFECDIHFDRGTRSKVEDWAEVGNYILRSTEDENEFYTIIDCEIDTKAQKVYIYAEDDGLDLINDIAGAYEADQPYPIEDYILRFAAGAGWEIGINEVEGLTKKLSWDSSQTASARILSIAEAFDNCEISYSFKIKGLQVVKKYINIYEERGKETGVQLRLNKEIDSIVTSKTVNNLATALRATGGTPDDAEDPITLMGYQYDDDNFYIDGEVLKSRKALEKWSRYLWKNDDTGQEGGHITREFSSDTTSQAVLCEQTIAELKKICDMEVNYEIDISKLPENVKIGDRVNVVDDDGKLYLSSRVLVLESSEVEQTRKATLGEHLIRKSGISAQVTSLAKEFAKTAVSAARAKKIASDAKKQATQAQTESAKALKSAETAETAAGKAETAAEKASQSANTAAAQAQAASAAVEKVETSVSSMEETVRQAQEAAENARQAAETATGEAEKAETAARNAASDATEASVSAAHAQDYAEDAIERAETAKDTAEVAKTEAEAATITAIAAKLDAEQAEKDVAALGDEIETVSSTMKIDYARKTELTESTAELQTQISRNAAQLESTARKQMYIDETTNNALSLYEAAENAAALAQEQADAAAAEAEAAQQEAAEAVAAAEAAQAEADTAQEAYETAKRVADEAEADLKAAKKDLATISARADATEEEIAAAQAALDTAQTTADNAVKSAKSAAKTASTALDKAVSANTAATKAQTKAAEAVHNADLAQDTANEAKGNATSAKNTADQAAEIAATAQATADTARETANAAQITASNAYETAKEAQQTANAAQKTLQQANVDLAAAETRLTEVLADASATAEEVEAAQAAVNTAQEAAQTAQANAEAAQATADEANEYADNAQAAADEAEVAADEAQHEADEAQRAADIAKGYVYALAKRSIEAEAKIKQNADEIELKATRKELSESLGGVFTKEETEALISTRADAISLSVSKSVEELQEADSENSKQVEKAEAAIKLLSDCIQNLVTDGSGASLMTQTANGWTFSTSKIQEQVDSASESLADLIEKYGSVDAAIEAIRNGLQDVADKTEFVNIGTYTYTENGVTKTEPCIDLFESDSGFTVKITNTQILFTDGSKIPTRIETDGLKTENITVENDLKQTNDDVDGSFIWAVRSNGNYGLQWKAGET